MQAAIGRHLAQVAASAVVECAPGVWDCASEQRPAGGVCAVSEDRWELPSDETWVLVLAVVFGCLMAFGIGANDAANSWGTTVGSKAIGLRTAVLIGGLAEWFGAVSLGYGVSKTVQKGVAKPSDPECWACGYCDSQISVYMLGMMTALVSASVFLALASFTSMPVSTTHAIIGGVAGSTIAGVSFGCLNWSFDGGLGGIIASWVISPLLSGVIGAASYYLINRLTVESGNPRRNALYALPLLYGVSSFVMIFLILLKSKPTKDELSKPIMAGIAFAGMAAIALAIQVVLVPVVRRRFPAMLVEQRKQRGAAAFRIAPQSPPPPGDGLPPQGSERKRFCDGVELQGAPQDLSVKCETCSEEMEPETSEDGAESEDGVSEAAPEAPVRWSFACASCGVSKLIQFGSAHSQPQVLADMKRKLQQQSARLDRCRRRTGEQSDAIFAFRYLLVFIATLESFAHGANDTANATGAFNAVYNTFDHGLTACKQAKTPEWILAIAGAFVFLGMNTLGYRVIRTIGTELTHINYLRGFCIELASTLTVVIATVMELPVSTTHCQVGAVVFVGLVSFGPSRVAWPLFGRIVATWVITIPFAGLISGGLLLALRPALRT